jgi:hypothetical protein
VSQNPISIGGFPLPSDAPQFLGVLAVHVAAGLWCVSTGAIAMLSEKQPGRHPRLGTFYFWGLVVVFITMSILSAMRWAEDYVLFGLGALSLGSAVLGRQAAPSRSIGRIRIHVVAMATSYILMLTAFYVDNGKNLPLWRSLPHIAYWFIPSALGIPIIFRVLRHHPLLQVKQARGDAGRAA